MDTENIIKQGEDILNNKHDSLLLLSEASEFLRIYAGKNSTFFKNISKIESHRSTDYTRRSQAVTNMTAFINFLKKGLSEGISIERKAQIEVVSDFLEQANILIDNKKVHPAAPIAIIGAALEEFLRNWIEEVGLDLKGKKAGLDSYSTTLKEAGLIDKQDVKDIVSWAGLRNYAAHGEWENIKNKNQASLMIQGVNLFMRKYNK
ncbi:hypothetical protein C0580_02550 [Candidatus Parcubacteria bacterium]|nr:MAG: hypothetical protein C0580_02550 [Candidatus Parcubacteria bacterium]